MNLAKTILKYINFYPVLTALCLLTTWQSAHAADLRLKLNLTERSDVDRLAEPISSGIPLPAGAIFSDKTTGQLPLKLVDNSGKTVPAQFTPLAIWPDGSLRWVLIDFQASLKASDKLDYYLEQTKTPAPVTSSLKISDGKDKITVDTGAIQFVVNKIKFNLLDQVLINGSEIISPGHQEGIILTDSKDQRYLSVLEPPDEIKIESAGPLKAVILVRGKYRSGNQLFYPQAARYTVRIYAYDNKDYVRIFFTLENNGRYGFRHEDNISDSFLFNSLSLALPLNLEPAMELTSNKIQTPFTSGDRFFLFQRHTLIDYFDEDKNFQYFIKVNNKQVGNGEYADGWLDMKGQTKACTTLVRHFWQNYPKAITVESGNLSIDLWPQGETWPPDAKNFYKMRGGTHKSYEILLRFYNPQTSAKPSAKDLLTAFNNPLLALPSTDWFVQTNALGWIAPANMQSDDKILNEALQRYEKLEKCKVHLEDSEIQHEEIPPSTIYTERQNRGEGLDWYGWMDFGDLVWGGESGSGAYATGHYDWPYGMLLQFVRSEDYAFFDLGTEMVRHRMDVDQYHSKNGSPWLANFQWNEFGSHERWPEPWEPNPSHTWIKGLVLYHLLTGDPKSKEVALAVGEATTYYWTHDWGADGRPGSDELRIQGWCIENLIELYKLTGEKKYLDLAITVYRERTAPFINADGYTGNPKQVNVYQLVLVLEPMIELDLLINDETLKDDILRILEFLTKRAYAGGKSQKNKEVVLYQQYYLPYYMNAATGLKTATAPGYNFMTSNALAYAYWITGNENYLTLSKNLFKDATFYWQEDAQFFDQTKRSPIAYAAAHFPGSRSKVHGWINRYPQIFLYLLNHPKEDTTPPAVINDLEILASFGNIILDWTAPGDDANRGKATRYQIKYSNQNIGTELAWFQATNIQEEPVPGNYADMQKIVLKDFKPGKTYYFAIRSIDKANNISPISNVVFVELK